jgi:glutamyl-tRNA synthetase
VIRGDDHINNTPRQINIFNALGATPPLYAHVPMILGPDGKRLSKRHGAVSVLQYRTEGYLPEAMLNYLVRLGWSYGDQEIFSKEEMIEHFNLTHISRSPAIFNPEKLLWLNQHYLKTNSPDSVAKELAWHLEAIGVALDQGPSLVDIVLALRERSKTLVEMAEKSRFLFEEFSAYDEEAVSKEFNDQTATILSSLLEAFRPMSSWDKESIHNVITAIAESLALKMGKVAQPLRIAVTGGTTSPSIDVTLVLLGQSKTITRIERALDFIAVR